MATYIFYRRATLVALMLADLPQVEEVLPGPDGIWPVIPRTCC